MADSKRIADPAAYEAWYHTTRGAWIGQQELSLLLRLMQSVNGQSLLDVGSGTGYFSRGFSAAGLKVAGIDPDPAMVAYAQAHSDAVDYLQGDGLRLPFADDSVDFCTAVTSLCFIDQPVKALAEMWRVSRQGVVLGLLNKNSLLYLQKQGRGSYRGARWDTWPTVRQWIAQLTPAANQCQHETAIFIPNGGAVINVLEHLLAGSLPWGGFMAVYVGKRAN